MLWTGILRVLCSFMWRRGVAILVADPGGEDERKVEAGWISRKDRRVLVREYRCERLKGKTMRGRGLQEAERREVEGERSFLLQLTKPSFPELGVAEGRDRKAPGEKGPKTRISACLSFRSSPVEKCECS